MEADPVPSTARFVARDLRPQRAPPGAAAVSKGGAALGRLRHVQRQPVEARQRRGYRQLRQAERLLRRRLRRRRRLAGTPGAGGAGGLQRHEMLGYVHTWGYRASTRRDDAGAGWLTRLAWRDRQEVPAPT